MVWGFYFIVLMFIFGFILFVEVFLKELFCILVGGRVIGSVFNFFSERIFWIIKI